MRLRDRMERYERGLPEEAPRCDVCGLSYAFQDLLVWDETGTGGRHEYKREPGCEVCREPRRSWAQENDVTNEIIIRVVYEEAPTREEYEEWRREP